jgi:hypothetical protein
MSYNLKLAKAIGHEVPAGLVLRAFPDSDHWSGATSAAEYHQNIVPQPQIAVQGH